MAGKNKVLVIIIVAFLTAAIIAAAVIAYMERRDPVQALESGRRPAWAMQKLEARALKDPDDYLVQSWLVRLDLEAGRMEKASSRLRMMMIKAPDNYYTFHGYCLFNIKKENFSAAAKSCQRALDSAPARTTEDINLAASSYLKTGQLMLSLPLLQELKQRLPDDPQVNNNLGYYYMMRGNNEHALELFHQALKSDPGMATAHRNLARTFMKMGKYQESVDAYKSLLTIAPTDLEALDALTTMYIQNLKDPKTARLYYGLAVKNGLDKTRAGTLNAMIIDLESPGKSQPGGSPEAMKP